jgi:hypothetical protein
VTAIKELADARVEHALCKQTTLESPAFAVLQARTALALNTVRMAEAPLVESITRARLVLEAAQLAYSDGPTIVQKRTEYTTALEAEEDYVKSADRVVFTRVFEAEEAVGKSNSEITDLMSTLATAYNTSEEAKTDTLKTTSATGTARAQNLSGHTVDSVLVVPGAMKSGAPTKKACTEWFQTEFGEKGWRDKFASFWAFSHPRAVSVFISGEDVEAHKFADNRFDTAPLTPVVGGTPTSPPKRGRKLTRDELKAIVWENTMGTTPTGTCVLCVNASINLTQPHGFQMAHIASTLAGGSLAPNNLIATCAGCNGNMAGQDMQTWVKRNIQDPTRQKTVLLMLEKIQAQ